MLNETILDFPQREITPKDYAGFRMRAGAFVIDFALLYLIYMMIAAYLQWLDPLQWNFVFFGLRFSVPYFTLSIPYYTLMESSAKQATLGKMVMGLKVGDMEGRRISFLAALGRCVGSYLSALPLFVGYMLVLWTEKKQAFHDKLADTYVVKSYKVNFPHGSPGE
jgi:uncharacterized RDD family membrane protein YckC